MSTAGEQSGNPLSILRCERCEVAVKPSRHRFKGKAFLEFDMEQPVYDKTRSKKAFFDPSRSQDFQFISGTKMRALAKNKENPQDGFMCPGGGKVLAEYYYSFAPTSNGKVPKLVPA